MNNPNDKKIFLSLFDEVGKIQAFLGHYSLTEIRSSSILQKAIAFEILRLCRNYKKLGGRYAKEFGELHQALKDYSAEIEGDLEGIDIVSLLDRVSRDLSLLEVRIGEILKQF